MKAWTGSLLIALSAGYGLTSTSRSGPTGPDGVCVRASTTKTETRTEYDCKVEPVCVPTCSLWRKCGGACGHSRERRVLIKRVIAEEKPACACEPVAAPPPGPTCP